jgi:hypothetical protein
MESVGLLGWVVGAVGIALFVWNVVQGKKPVDEWETVFGKAMDDARRLIKGAEQMMIAGQIEKDQRKAEVVEWLKELHPALSERLRGAAVEAAVKEERDAAERRQQDSER